MKHTLLIATSALLLACFGCSQTKPIHTEKAPEIASGPASRAYMGTMELRIAGHTRVVDSNALRPTVPCCLGLEGKVVNAYAEPLPGAVLEIRQQPFSSFQAGELEVDLRTSASTWQASAAKEGVARYELEFSPPLKPGEAFTYQLPATSEGQNLEVRWSPRP